MKWLLDNVGFEVKLANDGAEAVEQFTTWQPDFIWMDRRMPVMDGLEATRRIRTLPDGDGVIIAAVTASSLKEDDAEMYRIGFNGIVHKPFRPDQIFDWMEQLLGISFVRKASAAERVAAEVSSDSEDTAAPELSISAVELAAVPEALRAELREALLLLGDQRITTAIDAIGQTAPELAEALHRQANNFDYEAILSHLEDGNTS